MNNNLTEMVFILDMSGSMRRLQEDTIGGYNTLIDQQKLTDGHANITTVLFDDRYILLHDRESIENVSHMTSSEYIPLGMTAMLDAIGRTITSVGQKLASLPEDERPGKVIVTIITDGYENASLEYNWKTIKEMISHQREKYNWIFTFIGANIDTAEVSTNLGIDARLSKKYTASKNGTQSVYCALSKSMSFVRGVSDENNLRSCVTTDALSNMLDEVE